MNKSSHRGTTLVGVKAAAAPPESWGNEASAPPPSRGESDGRRDTIPYGVTSAKGALQAPSRWQHGEQPSLFGLFVSDGLARGASIGELRPQLREALPPQVFLATPDSMPSRAAPGPHQIAPGTVLDRYKIEALIGTGGFASVYRAMHVVLRRPVAIKVLRRDVLKKRPDLWGQLAREAELAARLDHPNVVRIIDFCASEAETFLVMECVDGESLATTLRRGPLPAAAVVEIGIDLCRGLRAGLDGGLLHRDVKPANIMLTRRGSAKLVDFGLAIAFSELASGGGGAIVGTRAYVAPEQVSSPRNVDFRSDLFSLGATLFHALTGVPAFDFGDSSASLRGLRYPSVTPSIPASIRCPPVLAQLISWLLSRQMERRPTSYDVVEQELDRARLELAAGEAPS